MANRDSLVCPSCGVALRDADAIVEVGARLFHASCAVAAFADTPEWEHANASTLSEWARGAGRAGSA